MKKIVTICLVVFIAVVVMVLGGNLLTNKNQSAVAPTIQNTTPAITPVNTITTTEVAKHNTATDCWEIVNNKVYNVTSAISVHPGGAEAIINLCGKDATTAFNTKGGKGSHSPRAEENLAGLLVGNLQ